jgi:hypothetical protein
METSWLTGKVGAEHYAHTRPDYLRALEKESQDVSDREREQEKKPEQEGKKDDAEPRDETPPEGS